MRHLLKYAFGAVKSLLLMLTEIFPLLLHLKEVYKIPTAFRLKGI